MRVVGDEEGKGSKAMVMAMALVTRMAGEWSATVTKRSTEMVTWVAGKHW